MIQARLVGAKLATGDVLVFWDAHCEAQRHWAEPLLQRIKESRTSVVVPVIDTIDQYNFEYKNNVNLIYVNGFNWGGYFTWIDVSLRERDRIKRECHKNLNVCLIYSPVMAGGVFGVSREYFWEIGSYDEGMYGWGGENLELAFRVWMCGGTVEVIPCSRVGHIYRDLHAYRFEKIFFS